MTERNGTQGHSPQGCQGTSGFDHKRAVTAQLVLSWWILLRNACDVICLLGKVLPGKEPSPVLCWVGLWPCSTHLPAAGRQQVRGSSLALWHLARDGTCQSIPAMQGRDGAPPLSDGRDKKKDPTDGWLDRQTQTPPPTWVVCVRPR